MNFRRLRDSIEYLSSYRWGCLRRTLYERRLRRGWFPSVAGHGDKTFPVPVYALSGRNQLAEQVASLHSFLAHVGVPPNFFVVSDGTFTPADERLLTAMHPAVRIIPRAEILAQELPASVRAYAETGQPLGLKLAALWFISAHAPAVYTDADVLFFPDQENAFLKVASDLDCARYMEDANTALDLRLLDHPDEAARPVNSGLLYFARPLDWTLALSRLGRLDAEPIFFTEQTVAHLAMHQNGGLPFDPRRFVVRLDDQLRYRDRYVTPETAARHYVSPVRYKFWLKVPLTTPKGVKPRPDAA